MIPVVIADGGACLVIGAQVGQFVIAPEGFAGGARADAAGDVELPADHALPDSVDRVDVGRVAGERRDIGDAGIHVSGANGVADRLGLLHHFLMRLVVLAARASVAVRPASVEHKLGQVEISLLAGSAVKFDQSHLRNLVTGPDRLLAWTESLSEEVSGLERNVQQRAFARGLIMSHGGLVEMSQVIKLVAVHLLQHPTLRSGPSVRAGGIYRARGVKVAVRLLGRADLRNQSVEISLQLGVGMNTERIRGAFEHFVRIGVVEGVAGRALVLERLASERRGGALEIIDALRLFALLEGKGNGHRPIDLDARRPEDVVEMDGGERHRFDRIITGRLRVRIPYYAPLLRDARRSDAKA